MQIQTKNATIVIPVVAFLTANWQFSDTWLIHLVFLNRHMVLNNPVIDG